MLNNEPVNLAEFLDEINRLEGIAKPPLSVDIFAASSEKLFGTTERSSTSNRPRSAY